MKIQYDIHVPSELSAGLHGFDDTVIVHIHSGDPGGEKGEFAEYMRECLAEWYDGGHVTCEGVKYGK